MKTTDTELFGKLKEPETFRELLDLLSRGRYGGLPETLFWRGQADVSWRIDSGAFRRLETKKLNSESELRHYERYLLDQATLRGYRSVNGREMSDLELLARLQHHGAATRLIDFSRNCMVGLWFAVSSQPRKKGLLIGVEGWTSIGTDGDLYPESYEEIMKQLDSDEDEFAIRAWAPPIVTGRVDVQNSQLLFSKLSSEPHGSLSLSVNAGLNEFIVISPSVKKEAITGLKNLFGITEDFLFPDIDGFCNSQSYQRPPSNLWRF